MRQQKTMVRAAVASMLFGGTLGVAEAGVTGVAGNTSAANLSVAFNYETYDSFGAYGSPMNGAVSFSDETYGSITCTQFTGSGFSLTAATTAQANNQSFFVQQNFIVTDAVNFTLVGFLPVSSSRAIIETGAGATYFADSGSDAGPFNLSGTLQAGEYRFAYWTAGNGPVNGTLFNLSFTAVPAPGAMALLGAAGLAAGRRRRG